MTDQIIHQIKFSEIKQFETLCRSFFNTFLNIYSGIRALIIFERFKNYIQHKRFSCTIAKLQFRVYVLETLPTTVYDIDFIRHLTPTFHPAT